MRDAGVGRFPPTKGMTFLMTFLIPSFPGLYARVAPVLDWIVEVIQRSDTLPCGIGLGENIAVAADAEDQRKK